MKKAIRILFLLTLFATIANAQGPEPVKWAYEYKSISATEGELIYKATIDKGWHVFSQYNPPSKDGLGGAQPLMFIVINDDNFEVVGKVEEPVYQKAYNDIWESDEYYFTDSVVFRQKIKLKTTKPFTVNGTVAGQVCSDDICIQTGGNFSIKINP
ncbi:MAG: sugar transporter [Sphingobacteriales bacterium JAD_PAG50586_3]|nr:MAG: sugar transporter [Sphingobacteriales bacterium JAD_PAG50586_3]